MPLRTLLGIPLDHGIPHGKRRQSRVRRRRRRVADDRARREREARANGAAWGKSTKRFLPGRLFLQKINDHELSCRTRDREFFRDPTTATMSASSSSSSSSLLSSSSSFSSNVGWGASVRIPRSLSVAAMAMPQPRFANLMSKPTTKESLGPGAYMSNGPRSVLRLQPLPADRGRLHAREKERASATFRATERGANAPFGHMRTWADERNDRENRNAKRAALDRVAAKKQQLEDEMEERDEAAAEAAEAKKLEETGQQEAPWAREANNEYRSMRRALREKNKIRLRSDNLEENFIKASLGYLKDLEKRKRQEEQAAEAALDAALKHSHDGAGAEDASSSGGRSDAKKSKGQKKKNKKEGRSGEEDGRGDGPAARGIRIFRRDDQAEAEFLEWQKSNSIANK